MKTAKQRRNESKEIVLGAGTHDAKACKELVLALFGQEYGSRLLSEYREGLRDDPRSWLQVVCFKASTIS